MPADTDSKWHLDRKVPIALITAIAIQTATAIWWAASLNSRVGVVEKEVAASGVRITRNERELSDGREKVAVVLEQIRNTNVGLNQLRAEVMETNRLLREALRSN